MQLKGFLLIPALVAAALLYAVFDEESGVRTWLQMRSDLGASRVRISEIRRENRALRQEAALLESDPFAIESAIREDLNLARRGERLVRLPAPEGTNPRFP
jgi:cell division protein FtsB